MRSGRGHDTQYRRVTGWFVLLGLLAGCGGGGNLYPLGIKEQQRPTATPTDTPVPPPATGGSDVQIRFRAAEAAVPAGGATTLSWTANQATGCEASGAWSGRKAVSGSESIRIKKASETFVLTCEGRSGTAVSMVTVAPLQPLVIKWLPPEENVDGTALRDLGGFRLYYGTESGVYDSMEDIRNPNATELTLELTPDTYYLAMTAVNRKGEESDLSNEIVRSLI